MKYVQSTARLGTIVLVLAALLLLPGLSIAEQIVVILDPDHGRAIWQAVNTAAAPGLAGVIRDDLLASDADHERIICYKSMPLATVRPVERVRYLLDLSSGAEFVEIIDGTGDMSGVEVKYNDTAITAPCVHTNTLDGCRYSGIPREMFGAIFAGSLQVYMGGGWHTADPDQAVIQFQHNEIDDEGNVNCNVF